MTQQRRRQQAAPAVELKALGDVVTALKAVPLTPPDFPRAAAQTDGAFLLDEALRFFNFGASREKTAGEAFVVKNFAPIDAASMEQALGTFCRQHAELIYQHVGSVYRAIGPKSLPDFAPDLAKTEWGKHTAADVRQKAVLVPLSMFGRLDGPAVAKDVLQLARVAALYQQSCAELQQLHGGVRNILPQLDADERDLAGTDPWHALATRDWVGNAHAVTFDTAVDASYLTRFCGDAPAGLTEKIYSALVLCTSTASFRGNVFSFESPFGTTYASRALEAGLREELEKLDGRFGVKGRAPSSLETWLEAVRALEGLLGRVYYQVPALPAVAGAGSPLGVARSDLIWGFVLCTALRLHLVRATALALVASVPFRQIYEGGKMYPGEVEKSVSGWVGIIGISLWEHFSGAPNPHPFSPGAADFAAEQSGWNAKGGPGGKGWVDPAATRTPPAKVAKHDNPLFRGGKRRGSPFPELPIAFQAQHQEAQRVYRMLQLPLAPFVEKKVPSPLQRYAALNSLRPSPRGRGDAKAWREALDASLASFRAFPPAGPFPIPWERNPPILDEFFVLGDPAHRVFNKWGPGSDSALSYANKLGSQLQMYVSGWLYARLLEDAKTLFPEFGDVSGEIKFTCGSLQYGGKFPPHITHRDGHGVDWSLYGKPGQSWHWSVEWPRDDSTREATVDGAKQEISHAKSLMSEETSLRTRCQLVRQALAKVMNDPKAPAEALAAAQADIKDIVPADRLGRYTSKKTGQYSLEAVPSDPLIAQHRDTQNDRHGLGRPAYVFREDLRTRVYEDQERCVKELHDDPKYREEPLLRSFLDLFAPGYRDWPVFPDRSSHWAHHLAHLAVVLGMPLEICWGAPIYHFRAIRAACLAFLEAPAHPFLSKPTFEEDQQGEEYEQKFSSPETDSWPLPLPRLYFLPNDHHHHWHINFWRSELDPLPGDIARRLSPELRAQQFYLRACLPMWVMLGVDFAPFIAYLDQYKIRRATGALLDEVNAYKVMLKVDHGRLAASLAPHFTQSRAQFRQRLAQLALQQFEDPGSLEQWPLPGSFLDEAIRRAEAIRQGIDRKVRQIKPELLPPEINEALRLPPEEKALNLQRADEAIPTAAGEQIDPIREVHTAESEGDPAVLDSQFNKRTAEPEGERASGRSAVLGR